MKSIFMFLFLVSTLKANAVEYVCWQVTDMQGMAYESSSVNCPDGKKVETGKGGQTTGGMQKEIVCIVPAMCLALTPDVVEKIKEKTSLNKLEEIKKLDSTVLLSTLMNSAYRGLPSQVVCKGFGAIKPGAYGPLSLADAKCPDLTSCANTQQVFYNMSAAFPANDNTSPRKYGTSPLKTVPTEVKQ